MTHRTALFGEELEKMGRIWGEKGKRDASENNYALKGLCQDCDPGPLIRLYGEAELSQIHKKVAPVLVRNAWDALLFSGNGRALLSVLTPEYGERLEGEGNQAALCDFHLLLSEIYGQMGRWEEAAGEQNRAMEHYGRLSRRELEDNNFRWMLCRSGYDIRLALGQTEGLEPLLRQLLVDAPDPWRQVEAHLLLGLYYRGAGDQERAEEHLKYAAERGNKLYARTRAEAALRELRGEGPNGEDRAREALRRMKALSDPLDPQPSLDICLETLGREELREAPMWRTLLALDGAADLVNLGRYGEALALLEQVDLGVFAASDQGKFRLQRLYLSLLARMELGELEEAVRLQNEAVELLDRSFPKRGHWKWTLGRTGCELMVRLGQMEGIEEKAGELLAAAEDELDRLAGHMLLGRYYLGAGEREKARPHLEYVLEHGGEHHFRRDAEGLKMESEK